MLKNFSRLDEELDWNQDLGIAWQRERKSITYEKDYWDKYTKYYHSPLSRKLNKFRCEITEKYCKNIIDVGIGAAEFICKLRINAFGFDINEIAVKWLKDREIFLDPYKDDMSALDGITLWDVIEHIPEPAKLIKISPKILITSIPIFPDLLKIRESKHYRPNEHLQYFTEKGIINYMKLFNYNLIEKSDEEIKIGRENIFTYVFKK